MKRAEYNDKNLVIDILTKSFDNNKSVNYIIKQDKYRVRRIRKLMEYSFDVCYLFGEVFLSDDKKSCALILLPDKKRTTLKLILLDMKLIFFCMGMSNIKKALKRESMIKKMHPDKMMYYLWFIGVEPSEQNKGIGSTLLRQVIQESITMGRPIYLETSTNKNIPWYEKFGFTVYGKLDFDYSLYCLKRE